VAEFDRPIAGFRLTQAKLADCALELDKITMVQPPGQRA